MRKVRKTLIALALVVAAALGWGYWHAVTHASLHVSVHDVALKTDRQRYGHVTDAEIVFLDGGGDELARGGVHPPIGVFAIRHPQVGDCREFENAAASGAPARDAWRQCFQTISRWLVTWVEAAHRATVTLGSCRIVDVPVSLHVYRDGWWSWWVPLPHVGGKPYTLYSLALTIDSAHCIAAELT